MRLILSAAFGIALPEVRKRLTDMGAVVTPLPAKEFGAFIRNDLKSWAEFVTAAKIKTD